MTADIFLRYLLTFLAGATFGASILYTLLRGFLAGVGRAMPFRDDGARSFPHAAALRESSWNR